MRTAASLRANFSWTFAGNAIYGVSQWAILSLLAKSGGAPMLGEYSFAVAVAGPVSMLSHLNLRTVLATDIARRHPFGDYLAVRATASVVAVAAIAVAAAVSGRFTITLLLGVSLAAENWSDLYYGALQRRERMDSIARSLMARSFVSVAAVAVVLLSTGSLTAAVAALALARIAVMALHDRRLGAVGEKLVRTGAGSQLKIFRTALPLGVVLMLISLTTNLPRYSVERRLGAGQLGVFAAVASFVTMAQMVMNALGQSATPRLAKLYSSGDLAGFRSLAGRMAAIGAGLGAAGVLGAIVAGPFVLALLYRAEFAAYNGVLVGMMAAGALFYVSGALGYVTTSARAFGIQMPLYAASAAVCGLASFLLVPVWGLHGAVVALALSASAQIAGQLLILRGALRGAEARP